MIFRSCVGASHCIFSIMPMLRPTNASSNRLEWRDVCDEICHAVPAPHARHRPGHSAGDQRGFAVTNDASLAREFRDTSAGIPQAFAELKAALSDNPAQSELLASTEPILTRRLAVSAELLRL